MTDVRLAVGMQPSPGAVKEAFSVPERTPSLLVSYVYLPKFEQQKNSLHFRDWVMDSGAFSAANIGATIHLQDYIDVCKDRLLTDVKLTEVFALDVIGDWKATLKNTEEMWKQGIPAIPTFHLGEPEEALLTMVRDYDKIAIGGAVGFKGGKLRWAEQVFARVWPKKIHGFGFGGEKAIMRLPFHSVDATNWEIGPCKFGRWASYSGSLSVRGSKQPLRVEVEHYLDLEAKAKELWRKEMAQLQALDSPSIRLAAASANAMARYPLRDQPEGPTVRLACATSGEGRWEVFK